MATARKLLSILGKSTTSAAFQALVAADKLKRSKQPPSATHFIGKQAGYEIIAERDRVVTIFLYSEAAEGFAAFPRPLPFGVPRGATRTEVRLFEVKPERSGKASTDDILGPRGAWDRFAVESIRVHFEYTHPGLQVKLVTIMTEDASP